MQGPIQIPADLLMHAHAIRTRLDENRSVGVRVLDHQMMIQFDVREPPDGFSNRRAHCEIRHEMTVHDVHMDHLGARFFHAPDFLAQSCKVRREYGWENLHYV